VDGIGVEAAAAESVVDANVPAAFVGFAVVAFGSFHVPAVLSGIASVVLVAVVEFVVAVEALAAPVVGEFGAAAVEAVVGAGVLAATAGAVAAADEE
jgi:hypothetical protein